MNTKREVVAFDVDGVIFDSTDECIVIAWNAYQELNGNRDKIYGKEEANIDYDRKFRSIRNYVRSMDEYLVVFNGNYSENPNQADFEQILSKIDDKQKVEYSNIFYNERKSFKKKFYEEWINLHNTYEGIIEILSLCSLERNLYMVTGKDKTSVKDLLDHFAPKVRVIKIYDKHAVENKLIALKKIAKNHGFKNEQIKFIDDNVTHLYEPQRNNFNIGLAQWGYAMPDHISEAEKRNIPILSLTDLKDFIGL